MWWYENFPHKRFSQRIQVNFLYTKQMWKKQEKISYINVVYVETCTVYEHVYNFFQKNFYTFKFLKIKYFFKIFIIQWLHTVDHHIHNFSFLVVATHPFDFQSANLRNKFPAFFCAFPQFLTRHRKFIKKQYEE